MSGEKEIKLSKQLLDLTKQMLDLGYTFSLKLLMPNFDFSVHSKKKEAPKNAIKKKKYKSTSQRKRDHTKKQKYLQKKV